MKVFILMGSPRIQGNTAELCKPFIRELKKHNAEVRYIELDSMTILSCKGCYVCQDIPNEYGCVQNDDMHLIVENMLWSDCIILATPIYAWYCTSKMKAVLDRHYGLNKYYGSAKGSLWAGKKVGILATHGYEGAYATEPFEMGVERLCKHSHLEYMGIYSVQDEDNLASFQTKEAQEGAENFARKLVNAYIRQKYKDKLERLYDENGKLIQYPSKRPLRPIVLEKIAQKFEVGKTYTEKEVNAMIQESITFTDIELIRRELYQYKFMERLRDGSKYWVEERR